MDVLACSGRIRPLGAQSHLRHFALENIRQHTAIPRGSAPSLAVRGGLAWSARRPPLLDNCPSRSPHPPLACATSLRHRPRLCERAKRPLQPGVISILASLPDRISPSHPSRPTDISRIRCYLPLADSVVCYR